MAKLSLDVKKCKAGSAIGLQKHDQREPGEKHSNKEIDDSKTNQNYDLHNPEKISFTDKINQRIKEENIESKRALRSDANVMLSVVIQAKKEFFEEIGPERQAEFFKASYEIMRDKVGKENVIAANVHLDEKSPHLHFKFVPITPDHRLRGGEMCNKHGLSAMHTLVADKLKERGFAIERGEPECEKREHLTPQQFKLQELEQEILSKSAEFEKISVAISDIVDIDSQSEKNEKGFFRDEQVKVKPANYNKLVDTAKAGALVVQENRKLKIQLERRFRDQQQLQQKNLELEHENNHLKGKIIETEKFFKDPQISQRIDDIQNPHLAAYRDYKKEAGITAIQFDGMDKYEKVAQRMMRENTFERSQIQEALCLDLNRDDAYNVMSGADIRINQDYNREKAEQERIKVQADQEQARVEAQQQIIDRQIRIDKNPNLKKYQGYKAKKMDDIDIIFRLKYIDKMPEYKIKEAIVDDGQTKEYAVKCVCEINKVKIPTKSQFKANSMSDGSCADSINTQLKAAQDRSPSPGGGIGRIDLFPLSDEEIEQIERAMEQGLER